jgi:hypothetical protein
MLLVGDAVEGLTLTLVQGISENSLEVVVQRVVLSHHLRNKSDGASPR